jgi:site-specific DNA recombinase
LRQQERCRAFALAKGWEPIATFSDVDSAYRSPGQKAPPKREAFERALTAIETGEIEGLVFFKLDRLCRDHGDFERVLATCERHGAVLASVMEPIDTSTPAGEMSARMLVGFARLESQTIGLRVAAQREQTASRGLPSPGGWRPFGYRYVPRTDQAPARYEVAPEEAEVIVEAARRVLAGESLNSVAAAPATGSTSSARSTGDGRAPSRNNPSRRRRPSTHSGNARHQPAQYSAKPAW